MIDDVAEACKKNLNDRNIWITRNKMVLENLLASSRGAQIIFTQSFDQRTNRLFVLFFIMLSKCAQSI